MVPVFYNADVETSKAVLKACYEGGVRAFEFTNRGDFAHEVFGELVKYANTHASADNAKVYLEAVRKTLTELCDILGVIVEKEEELLDEEIENLIAERQAARKAKDFARADEIRNELLEKGIILKDTREGVQWKRA